MKKVLLFIAFFILTAGYTFSQGVIISEIVASPSGNYPKYVELTNTSAGEINLNGYTVNLYVNGNTTVFRHYTFASDFMLPSEASVVLTNMDNSTDGQKWSDFNLNTPNLVITSTVAYGNGNDVYELVDASDVVIDRYGNVGNDFTGEDWEYTKSYSFRKSTVHTPTPDFESLQWYCAGVDALVGHEDDLSPYLTPGTHILTNSTGSLSLTYPTGGENFNTGETVTITWTSSGINELVIQGKKTDEEGYETLTDDPVKANIGSLDFPVPTDAEEGDYQLRLVCVEDPTLMSESGEFHITDIHFGGLDDNYPFWPENGATGVSIVLNDHKITINFNEPVQPGTGNAYLKKFSDNSIVKTFNANNPNDFFTNPNNEYSIMFDVGSDLDPDTKYYVEIENGAIIDMAPAQNKYEGFSGSDTWSFTTEEATMINKKNSDIVIGPNPVTNKMIISAQKPITRIQILNYVGQTIEDKKISGQRVTIPVTEMSKGIYLVRVSFTDGTVKVQKVIKR